jgi:type II secretory ATPase GspE/PulE/Tfp pilus assembly ATPase PilB-like protein
MPIAVEISAELPMKQGSARMDSATKERAGPRPAGRGNRWEKLVEAGLMSAEALAQALAAASNAHVDPARFLFEQGGLTRGDVETALSRHFGCPFYRFSGRETVLPDLRPRLRLDFLRKMCAAPVERRGARLLVVVDDPLDATRTDALRSIDPGHELLFQVGLRDEIVACLEYSYGLRGDPRPAEPAADGVEELADRMVIEAHRRGASDVHVEPNGQDQSTVIRLRVAGECELYQEVAPALGASLIAHLKQAAGLELGERQRPQEGKFDFRLPDRTLKLRVTTVPTVHGNEDLVMHLLGAGQPMGLGQLGLSPRNLAELEAALARSEGLFLCVGPTGSGTTTTLHAALGHLNTADVKIWTAEDPVEITQPGLRQVQVHPKIGFDFPEAIRSIARADPDVIMIGELRDRETASSGIDAALAGHMVMAAMHSRGAPEALGRLMDLQVDRHNLGAALVAVLAQRLVRGLCPHCQRSHPATPEERGAIIEAVGPEAAELAGWTADGLAVWRAPGCGACGGSGAEGRVAVHEMLVMSDELREAVADAEPVEELRRVAVAQGMVPLVMDGIGKAVAGKADLAQVLAACSR